MPTKIQSNLTIGVDLEAGHGEFRAAVRSNA